MKPLIKRLRTAAGSGLARNISGIMLLTAVGQGSYLAIGPLLTRHVSPAEFGLYGLFYAFMITVANFACLYFDFAIPVPREDADAGALTLGAVVIGAASCGLACIVFAAFIAFRAFGFGLFPYWAAPLCAVLLAVQITIQLQQAWRVRRQEAPSIAWGNLTLNLARGAAQVSLAILTGSWLALVAGEFAGRIFNSLQLARGLTTKTLALQPWRKVWRTLSRYRHFPLVLMPASLIDSVVSFGQTAAMGLLFGPAAMGQYFLMRRSIDLPVGFVFRTLSDLFYSHLADHARNAPERIRPFFTLTFFALLAGGCLLSWPLILFGPQLFRWAFGAPWEQAGRLAAIMTPAAVMNLSVAPISRVFAITRRQGLRYVFSTVSFLGNVTVLGVVRWRGLDIFQATLGISAVAVVSYFLYFLTGYVASGDVASDDVSAAPISSL
jgi:O-antigen/teichoic acid export membrane protein